MIDEIQRFSRPALGETPILCNRQHDYCRFAALGYGLGGAPLMAVATTALKPFFASCNDQECAGINRILASLTG